jgi:hypothetical protein
VPAIDYYAQVLADVSKAVGAVSGNQLAAKGYCIKDISLKL